MVMVVVTHDVGVAAIPWRWSRAHRRTSPRCSQVVRSLRVAAGRKRTAVRPIPPWFAAKAVRTAASA